MKSRFDYIAWVYDLAVRSRWSYNPDRIRKPLNLSGDEVIADLGGGTGVFASALAPYCKQVTVIDESARMLARVPKTGNINVVQADIRSLPVSDASYDIALMIDVVHHVRSADRAVAEAYRILKPGGRLLVMDFDAHSIRARSLWLFEVLIFGHIHYRTPEEMIELLRGSGFADVRCEDCAWDYVVMGHKR